MHIALIFSFSLLGHHVQSCLLPSEGGPHLNATQVAVLSRARRLTRRQTAAIGTGDRFAGGTVAPKGLGTQPAGASINSVMNVAEIRSAVEGLKNEFGIELFTSSEQSHNGATMFGGKVFDANDKKCEDAYRVFLQAGIHARERGGPDNLIYFISDLLWAKKLGTGLEYGARKYTNTDVITALSTGIVFMPLVNPDGVAWDQQTGSCWRKNRNPSGAVDLNRNFDYLWDYKTKFAPGQPVSTASDNPALETYHGQSAFSEPETRNVKSIMDKYSKLRWFLDLHSFSGLVLYNWGDDTNQDFAPTTNFRNAADNGKRGTIPDVTGQEYSEYIPAAEWNDKISTSMRVANAMQDATGRGYAAKQAAYLYPTSGASDDYAYSRSFANPALNKMHGYTVEFGFANFGEACPFYPTTAQFNQGIRESGAGFMEFLLQAHKVGLGTPRICPTVTPPGTCAKTCTPGACGGRATCEVFNPLNSAGANNAGKSFCFCQAGYKATGAADGDVSKQYHLTWQNSLGDQTHRVLVNPGQDCWDTCQDNVCSEVKLNDACR